jgi:hypothetical protein
LFSNVEGLAFPWMSEVPESFIPGRLSFSMGFVFAWSLRAPPFDPVVDPKCFDIPGLGAGFEFWKRVSGIR